MKKAKEGKEAHLDRNIYVRISVTAIRKAALGPTSSNSDICSDSWVDIIFDMEQAYLMNSSGPSSAYTGKQTDVTQQLVKLFAETQITAFLH